MIFVFALVRALHLASLMVLFGSAMLLIRLRARVPELGIESRGLRRLRLTLVGMALVTAPLWPGFTASPMLFARPAVLILLCAVVLARREIFTALLAGLGLILIAVTSHAAAASPAHFAVLGIATDTLHLLCGGIWLGGLCVLAAVMAQRVRAPRLAAAITLFAGWGMIAVTLLALTGLLNAASIVLGGPGHASGIYLGVLGAKLVLVLTMILLALNNHFRLLPRLDRPDMSAIFQGNIAWELALGLGVVVLASLLGLLAPTL